MSPLPLRRYRAERLLRRDFEALRSRVLRLVAGRLRAQGIELDRSEVEAAYGLAWQGLYAAVLDGEPIENPAAWLVLVTFRRAVEEHRGRRRSVSGHLYEELDGRPQGPSGDLAEDLDARIRLEQLLEGLSRLSERERAAATLCYLQGLSRADAAARLGISPGRMRKLMEGRGAGDPGVCAKIGALARTIEQGAWCESQGSLMRALAYGILDSDGERHRLAVGHHRRCPACRAYVVALRGVAASIPPVALPWPGAALGALAGVVQRLRGVAGHLLGRAPGGPGGSGAAGVSGAGGGLALAGGPFGGKLAIGCLMAIGFGAGCIGLEARSRPAPVRGHAQVLRSSPRGPSAHLPASAAAAFAPSSAEAPAGVPTASAGGAPSASSAAREFGPERLLAQAVLPPAPHLRPPASAGLARAKPARAGAGAPMAVAAALGTPRAARAAQREFAP